MSHIAIIGNGAWGRALATLAANNGKQVIVWGRRSKGLEIAETTDLAAACDGAEGFVMALPCVALPEVCSQMAEAGGGSGVYISACKGMLGGTSEGEKLRLPSDILAGLGGSVCVLSGPNFASEVSRGFPAATSVAGAEDACQFAVRALSGRHFRIYREPSMQAVELCGVMKNVIAIACGVSLGLGFGENARSALMTRGLAEMRRLVQAVCGNAGSDVVLGLSGVGDLSLTCGSMESRNMAFGFALGQGTVLDVALGDSAGVCEGFGSSKAIAGLADSVGVDMPIAKAVVAILHGGKTITDAITELLNRPVE